MAVKEETVEDTLNAIVSFSVQLKKALEENDQKVIKDSLNNLKRQNRNYLYRVAKREKLNEMVKLSQQISAQIAEIKGSLDKPEECMKYVGMIITLCGKVGASISGL